MIPIRLQWPDHGRIGNAQLFLRRLHEFTLKRGKGIVQAGEWNRDGSMAEVISQKQVRIDPEVIPDMETCMCCGSAGAVRQCAFEDLMTDTDAAFQTLAVAITGGTFLTVLSRKFALPTIVLLFGGGLAFGPSGLGWIDPVSVEGILPALVSLAIGIILFEGGLTLEPRDYLRSPVVIKRLLTIGALVTWVGSAAAVRFVFEASWEVSLLAGSLVIVTGPTVIIPLLKRLRLVPRVASILHWEGVMIDAIGVFLAVLCFELVVVQHPLAALSGFAMRIAVGGAIGLGGGWLIQRALEKNWVPDNLINPFVLACAVGLFALAEWWIHESGLLAATLAGVWVARRRSTSVRQLRTFKAELSDLLIGTLFLLLVSRLDLRLFASEGPRLLLVVLVVMLIVRPLNILFSTVGAGLGWKERAFLGWVAPRGIVAASMASLFALQLSKNERFQEEAMLLEMFTYSVICGTVVVQGLSAGWMAKWLGLNRPPAKGWLIVGANRMGRSLASELMRQGGEVMIMDVNQRNVQTAMEEGIPAIHGDARDVDTWETDERFGAFGHMLALTDNAGLNQLLATTWAPLLGRKVVHAWNSGRHKADVADRFASLPRPSVLSEEIRNGAAAFVVANQAAMPQAVALFGITPDGIKTVSEDPLPEGTPHLFLVRSGGYLDRAIERGSRIQVSCDSLNALNELLIEEALRCEPRLSREQLRSDLLAQEKLMPPFLGHGVAAPHAFSTQVARRICVCAVIKPALEIPNLDEPVHTAYCIISPAGDPEGHLATLAEIAKKHYDSGGPD